MKILFVDISLTGHRLVYLKAFENLSNDCFALLPEVTDKLKMSQFIISGGFNKKRNLRNYKKFIEQICWLVKEKKIEVVHILCGDALYRYFGMGLQHIHARLYITYHHMDFRGLKRLSIKKLFQYSTAGIVHTKSLFNELSSNSIDNKYHIEYPMLDRLSKHSVQEARVKLGIKKEGYVIGVIGGTQRYKGLNFLLEALNNIKEICTLFIAGVIRDYDELYIRNTLHNKNVKLSLMLRELTPEEFADAVQASDIIALPYTFEFDGASGPLVSGLFHKKIILASEHGSLGYMVNNYKLGKTFKTEDADSLSEVLNDMLENMPEFSKEAEEYTHSLSVENFQKKHKQMYNENMKI